LSEGIAQSALHFELQDARSGETGETSFQMSCLPLTAYRLLFTVYDLTISMT
jgi:hypothetical protein